MADGIPYPQAQPYNPLGQLGDLLNVATGIQEFKSNQAIADAYRRNTNPDGSTNWQGLQSDLGGAGWKAPGAVSTAISQQAATFGLREKQFASGAAALESILYDPNLNNKLIHDTVNDFVRYRLLPPDMANTFLHSVPDDSNPKGQMEAIWRLRNVMVAGGHARGVTDPNNPSQMIYVPETTFDPITHAPSYNNPPMPPAPIRRPAAPTGPGAPTAPARQPAAPVVPAVPTTPPAATSVWTGASGAPVGAAENIAAWQDMQKRNATYTQRMQPLDEAHRMLYNLEPEDVGPLSEPLMNLRAAGIQLGMIDPNSKASIKNQTLEVLRKNYERAVQAMPNVSGSADELHALHMANPNISMQLRSQHATLNENTALARLDRIAQSEYNHLTAQGARLSDGTQLSPTNFQRWLAEWNPRIDWRALVWDRLDDREREQVKRAMPKSGPARDRFFNTLEAAHRANIFGEAY
jgi:hypothetical protein